MLRIEGFRAKYASGEPVEVRKGTYRNGEIALVMIDANDGEQLCRPTLNLEEYGEHPREGHVFIKTYSENEGVLEGLQKAGVVGEPVRLLDVGYVHNGAAEVPLLKADEMAEL